MSEVGAALGASEEAAKKRVNRALEKLRKFFAKRGVSSTTATIAGAISANSVQAAPAALAKTATAMALAKGAAASTSTLTLIKGALKIMAWTKAKTAVAVGLAAILVIGTTTVAGENCEAFHFAAGGKLFHRVEHATSGCSAAFILPAKSLRQPRQLRHRRDGLRPEWEGDAARQQLLPKSFRRPMALAWSKWFCRPICRRANLTCCSRFRMPRGRRCRRKSKNNSAWSGTWRHAIRTCSF